MCGRYGFGNPARLGELPLGATLPGLERRFNVAPTQAVPVVFTEKDGTRRADLARWGLVPYWANDPSIGARMINARGDSVRTKPAFRAAFRARRALMPADLFYEWQPLPGVKTKQPWCIRAEGDAPFAFGALVEWWRPKRSGEHADITASDGTDDDWLLSCAIITTEPNDVMRPIHDRMPLILSPADYDRWLDPDTSSDDAAQLVRPYAGALHAYRVSTYVNAPRNDDERCIAPMGAAPGA